MVPQTAEEIAAAARFPYRELIGSVMFIMICTRSDISYGVGQLSMFMNCHGSQHHAAAKHLLRYLKGTADRGIIYRRDSGPLRLVGYSDADWGANVDTRRSTTGYIFMLCGGPISWKSKLQPTVALSSTEAEYMALTAAAQEAIALRGLLSDFGLSATDPVLIYEDNKGAIAMSVNPINHAATKHIAIKHHFCREKVTQGDITLQYIATTDMLADAMTKSLAFPTFSRLRDIFMGWV
jgi:hypothetical protein